MDCNESDISSLEVQKRCPICDYDLLYVIVGQELMSNKPLSKNYGPGVGKVITIDGPLACSGCGAAFQIYTEELNPGVDVLVYAEA